MKLFELDAEIVRGLVASVRGVEDDDGAPESEATAEAFARLAWTVLIEPADQVAGQVIAGLGARRALESVIADDPGPAVALLLADGVARRRAEQVAGDAFARWRPRVAARPVVRSIEYAAELGLRAALPGDPAWPEGFALLGPAAPVALWLRGDPARLPALAGSVAIVGARAATGYGEHVATELAGGIAERDVPVVSGGAYGIDAAAHRSALAADGLTAAFLAGGLDRYYPAGNADLLSRVGDTGLLIAEVPPGVPPTRVRFLTRNRLLAAVSDATVVVEAGLRSGSLNTAHHAFTIGRPVGVVPGPVTSAMSAGCHRLLREQDAVCVTSVDEVLQLAGGAPPDDETPRTAADPDVIRVLDALGPRRARTPDEIARSSGMAVAAVLGVLGALEVADVVERRETGWVRAVADRSRAPSTAGGGAIA
ncbi:MAG: DNA-processing protein DprA [Microbacteriaceae bacterium]|nr:DNA-processing protein DprA [Microbacteriaceae bacterium]